MQRVRKFALLSMQGTACSETVLTAREFTDKNKRRVEEEARHSTYTALDRPVPNTWTDVTDNDAC